MRKLVENLAVTLVVLLFLVIIVLIAQYNMIKDDSDDIVVPVTTEKPVSKKEQIKLYTNSLESYGNDVDVKVDPTKENKKNIVKVTSELAEDAIEEAVNMDEKRDYIKKLEQYETNKNVKTKMETLEDVKPQKEENGDMIGAALDDILAE
jgi:hypothetical protein